MQRWLSLGVFLASSAFLAASCGGNSEGGGGSCGKVQPCGGDPTGSWEIVASCIDTTALNDELVSRLATLPGCDSLRVESSHAEQTGTVTFGADMTYTTMRTVAVDAILAVPKSCIMQGGITLTCGQLNQLIQQFGGTQLGTVDCKDAAAGCACKIVTPPQAVDESGAYSVAGTKLTTPESAEPQEFCVQGNELHLITVDATKTDSSGRPRILTDLVGTKR